MFKINVDRRPLEANNNKAPLARSLDTEEGAHCLAPADGARALDGRAVTMGGE